jgi:hypothetical protein
VRWLDVIFALDRITQCLEQQDAIFNALVNVVVRASCEHIEHAPFVGAIREHHDRQRRKSRDNFAHDVLRGCGADL